MRVFRVAPSYHYPQNNISIYIYMLKYSLKAEYNFFKLCIKKSVGDIKVY